MQNYYFSPAVLKGGVDRNRLVNLLKVEHGTGLNRLLRVMISLQSPVFPLGKTPDTLIEPVTESCVCRCIMLENPL